LPNFRSTFAAAFLATVLAAPLARADEAEARAAASCPPSLAPWTQVDLYFGRSIGGAGLVTERAFKRFLAEEVTPRFPDGLTVLDAAGQFRDRHGRIVREPAKLLVLLVPDRAAVAGKIGAVIQRYKRLFHQESVLRTEQRVCLAF
jgi:hypothetical protein